MSPAHAPQALRHVLDVLRCPVCPRSDDAHNVDGTDNVPDAGSVSGDLSLDGRTLRCGRGHAFDVARQGYVALLDGKSVAHRSDTAEMVAARERVHDAAILDPVVAAIAQAAATAAAASPNPVIWDSGAGPGHYLRACLRAVSSARGIGTDLSKFCARRICGGDPAAAAVVADSWRPQPLKSASVDVAVVAFSPRNVDELTRILRPGGTLIVATPTAEHLAQLIEPMGMLSVRPDKAATVAQSLTDFDVVDTVAVRDTRSVSANSIADLAGMGPAGFHHGADELASRAAQCAVSQVSVAVDITIACRR